MTLLAGELLRRHVGRRARDRTSVDRAGAGRQAEVGDADAARRASSITLAGLRSRCSTPLSCAAARPAQICRAISSALSGGSRPMRRSSAARSSPSTYSIDRNVLPVGLADVVDAADVADARPGARCAPRRGTARARRVVGDGFGGQELQRDRLAERAGRRRGRPRPSRRGRQADDAVAVGEQRAWRQLVARRVAAGRGEPPRARSTVARSAGRQSTGTQLCNPGLGQVGFVSRRG